MRFAINPDKQIEIRIEASPGSKGLCIACKAEMIPKCGAHRIHHWAHKKRSSNCDEWWEAEIREIHKGAKAVVSTEISD
uniref:Competence protein CoiA-like N-terminal domain-containing protein n=1 Tax=uncultured bacterium EIL107F05 TaxID=1768198 RepID=A0A0U2M5I5_9BACT|nr:hypothetical protein [uncultured bacterium EIL107F05]